jgi:hypothetical protein
MPNVMPHAKMTFINMMKKDKLPDLLFKILPIIIIICSILLFFREFHQFNSLISKYDDNSYSYLLKYKEDTYCQLFLWSVFLMLGIVSLINDKIKWISYQIILTKLLISSLFMIFVEQTFTEIKILSGVFIIGLILVEIWLFNQKVISKFQINKVNIFSSITLSMIWTAIYWTIRLNF